MPVGAVPTKGNLIAYKKSLTLAKTGYELLDKKRNILVREMMTLIDRASEIQTKIDVTYSKAYLALQKANISMGFIDDIAKSVPEEDSIKLTYRSVMGVEIPIVTVRDEEAPELFYGLQMTSPAIDEAYACFSEVKRLTADLAEVENSVYRLADAIKKTQTRANALRNIIIPRFEEGVKFISDALDEKDREEFSRLEVIKAQKTKKEKK